MKLKTHLTFWTSIETAMLAGEFPPVFITADGQIGLDRTANRAIMPKRLAALIPAEIIAEAKVKRDEVIATQSAEQAALLAADSAKRADRQAEWLRATSGASHFGMWLETGFMGDFVSRRLGAPSGEKSIPAASIASVLGWNRFRETDSRTMREIGMIFVAPLDAAGEFDFTAGGQIANAIAASDVR